MVAVFFYLKDTMNDRDNGNYYETENPLLFSVDEGNYYLLPKNIDIQYIQSFPEGFDLFKMNFAFEGESLPIVESDKLLYRNGSFVTSPIWVRDIDQDELMPLINSYPLTKSELRDILSHSKLSKDQLIKLVDDLEM